MENSKEKYVLKIWLVLLVLFSVFSIINTFNGELFGKLFGIGIYSLNISNILLFAYVYSKGNKDIAKYGFVLILIHLLLFLAYRFDAFIVTFTDYGTIKDKILTILYYISGDGISIFSFMAFLGLIVSNNDKIENIKKIAIFGVCIIALLELVMFIVPTFREGFVSKISSTISIVSNCAYYAAIFLYLLGKSENSNLSIEENKTVEQQPEQDMNNQAVAQLQPMMQDMNSQVAVQTPPVMQDINSQVVAQPQPVMQDMNSQAVAQLQPVMQDMNSQVVGQSQPVMQDMNGQVVNNQTNI